MRALPSARACPGPGDPLCHLSVTNFTSGEVYMPHLFEPLTLRSVTFKNRVMMSPMGQYSANPDGTPTDWHYLHYASRAVGGVGLIMIESAAVESRGRNTEGDLGIWDDRHVEPLTRLVARCHAYGAKVGIQLQHMGRKAWSTVKGHGPEQPVSASPVPFDEGWAVPHALTVEEIDKVVAAFAAAARRAADTGCEVVEIHGAHGYLANQFLSPLTNRREDEYGGSFQGRLRFLHRVIEAVRSAWPERLPLFLRVSASEYAEGGIDLAQMVEVVRTLGERGVDLIDCSSGGVVPTPVPSWPGYQVPFAEKIRAQAGIPTAAVGLVATPEMADEIIRNQRADLVALGRVLLRHPYWPLEAAHALGVDVPWPSQYRRARL